jgi:hypothetical protein
MSKHKPALPERLYYRLADAAEWLTKQGNKCTADDLLHFGACGYLEICASADNLFAQGLLFDTPADYTEGRIKGEPQFSPDGGVFGLFDFFAVSAWKIGLIERLTECKCDSSAFIYRRSTKGLLQVAFDGRNQREDDSRPGVFALSVTPPSKGGMLSGDPARVTVSDLWVRTEELRRFQIERSANVRVDSGLPGYEKPIGITERNKTLAIVAALADAAGIDVNARGAATEIARMTETFGAAVSDDAVRDRLRQVPEALESFKA